MVARGKDQGMSPPGDEAEAMYTRNDARTGMEGPGSVRGTRRVMRSVRFVEEAVHDARLNQVGERR